MNAAILLYSGVLAFLLLLGYTNSCHSKTDST